ATVGVTSGIASGAAGPVAAEGAIGQCHRAAIVDAAAVAVPSTGAALGAVAIDRGVDQRQRGKVVDATPIAIRIGPAHGEVIVDSAVADQHAAFVVKGAAETASARWT